MKKNILAINGSASGYSSNLRLLQHIAVLTKDYFNVDIFDSLKTLPHFDPALAVENTPEPIVAIRQLIAVSDGIIICTPEYIFSIPGGLKNLIEWCVATTIFSKKPTGLIIASADGRKAEEELILIMKTVEAIVTPATTLLVQGVKGKIAADGQIIHQPLADELQNFVNNFQQLVSNAPVEL